MIKFRRQDGGQSSSNPAREPTSLEYGEPAVSSDGTIYTGDGSGKVKSLVNVAKKAFDATNGMWQFVGDFKADSWVLKESVYEQTAQVRCLDSDNVVMASNAKLSAPSTSQTDDFAQNEEKLDAIGIVNYGQCIPGDKEITIKCKEKPAVDLDIYWNVKLNGEYTEEEENMHIQEMSQYAVICQNAATESGNNSSTSKSWAIGETGTREDESTNNAKYWCEQAQKITQGAIGWYENEDALKSSHPTGENGQWAIIGDTDTIWTWDSDTSSWVDTGSNVDMSNYYTKLQAEARFQMPVGYIFDWAPVKGQNTDLSTPEKVAQYFGYGTWQEITGRFTFAHDASHEVGSTGGEASHVLTQAELPDMTLPVTTIVRNGSAGIQNDYGASGNRIMTNTDAATLEVTNLASLKTGGRNAAHNNMPPYLTVYKWQRVS